MSKQRPAKTGSAQHEQSKTKCFVCTKKSFNAGLGTALLFSSKPVMAMSCLTQVRSGILD